MTVADRFQEELDRVRDLLSVSEVEARQLDIDVIARLEDDLRTQRERAARVGALILFTVKDSVIERRMRELVGMLAPTDRRTA